MKRYPLATLLVVLLLAGLLPVLPQRSAAQTTPPPAPADAPIAFPCYSGARPPLGVLCLVVPVVDPAGVPIPNAKVTASFGGSTLTRPTEQLADQPSGSAVAALDVGSRLGARPGDIVQLHIESAWEQKELLVGLKPHPKTRTYETSPVTLGGAASLPTSNVWGTVSLLDSREALKGAAVTLSANGQVIGTTITKLDPNDSTHPLTPTFSFELPAHVQIGDRLSLHAIYETKEITVETNWLGNQVGVPIILGWSCIFAGPRYGGGDDLPRYGGGDDLPDEFCLTGVVQDPDGNIVEEAQVSIDIPDQTPRLTATRSITNLDQPAFATNIGPLLQKLAPNKPIRITVTHGQFVGTMTRTVQELGFGERWGQMLYIPLRSERMGAQGLRGGTPRTIALASQNEQLITYVSSPEGGGLIAQSGEKGLWLRIIGNVDGGLPLPDLSALLSIPGDPEHWLVAGTRTGELLISRDAGRSWERQAVGVGPVVGLAHTGDSIVVAGREGMHAFALSESGAFVSAKQQPASPAFIPTALVALDGQQLIAGTSNGFWSWRSGETDWQHLRDTPAVTALARINRKGATQLLVGTAEGLFLSNSTGTTWQPTGMKHPIYAVAASKDSTHLRVSTSRGIFEAPSSNLDEDWLPVTVSDLLDGDLPTIGTPDLFDIAVMPDERLVAATGTGLFHSEDGGLNWAHYALSLGRVRSVTPAGAEAVLALTDSGIVRVQLGHPADDDKAKPSPVEEELFTQADLNGTMIRSNQSGTQVLVGRSGGPGPHLFASTDGGKSWASYSLGEGRGVTAIAFFKTPTGGYHALVATDGDGIFGWNAGTGEVTELEALIDGGRKARIGALMISGNCRLIVGTVGPTAGVAGRPCTGGAWSAITPLNSTDGVNVGSVHGFASGAGERIFAVTGAGIFAGNRTATGVWENVFGLPLRPLTLLTPPRYEDERLLIAGGPQSGAVLLSDVAPDLMAQIAGPRHARGGELVDYTFSVRNMGLLPTINGTAQISFTGNLTLEPADQQLNFAFDRLITSAEVSRTLRFRVNDDTRPAKASLNLELLPNSAGSELIEANNQDTFELLLDYRDGPDLSVTVTGRTMTAANLTTPFAVVVHNLGTLPMPAGQLLKVSFPEEVNFKGVWPAAGNTLPELRWTLPAIQPGAMHTVVISYSLPLDITEEDHFLVEATVQMAEPDREPNNDQGSTKLRLLPANPQGIALTNWTRLARFGPVEDAQQQLSAYLAAEGGIEIALDGGKPALASAYATWDAAVQELNEALVEQASDKLITALAETALESRLNLLDRIEAEVTSKLTGITLAKPAFLYIVGGDAVIPGYAHKDVERPNQSIYPEQYHAKTLQADDPLYSVMYGSHYLSYAPYEQLADWIFNVGVAAGRPDDIAASLQRYLELDGVLNISRAGISGAAKDLTEDVQQVVCEQFKMESLPVIQDCDTLSPSVQDSLPELSKGGLFSLSDHSDQWNIGDVSSNDFAGTAMPLANLLLLLGCHSGLDPTPNVVADPSVVATLGAKGYPAFGFTAYAYAALYDEKRGLAYGELLHYQLVQRLLSGSNQLGMLLRQARADYGKTTGDQDDLRIKTRETFTLFGPPTYRVIMPTTSAFSPKLVLAEQRNATLPEPVLSISASFAPSMLAGFGTRYSASPTTGVQTMQLAVGHTVQPGVRIPLPAGATGALIRAGNYTDTPGVDPVVPRVAPMSAPLNYTEPPYEGPEVDWARPLGFYRDGDGQLQMVAGLGQWLREGAVQRLISDLEFEVIVPELIWTGHTPRLPGVAQLMRDGDNTTVVMPAGTNLKRAEIVLYDSGWIRVIPMLWRDGGWRVSFTATRSARFLIQAVGRDGSVIFDTWDDRLYPVQGTPVAEPAFAACPANWQQVGTYAGTLILPDKILDFSWFSLPATSAVRVIGYAKEGHPEDGCPGGTRCNQQQDDERFYVFIDGKRIGSYLDQGAFVNAWSPVGPWSPGTTLSTGQHSLAIRHPGTAAADQSVGYKLTLCARP